MQKYYEIQTKLGTMRGFFHKPDVEKFPVCIILHGFTGQNTGTKFSYVQLSRMLEKQNIGSMRMDFLGSGQSDLSFKDMTFQNELESAITILQEVKNMDCVTDIYLLGHSMGGAIASEVAKKYPQDISKMCLWAPAFNLPEAIEYLKGHVEKAAYYDHSGFEISHAFDTNGASFDENGSLNNWWTEADYTAFTERTDKIVEQFEGLDSYGAKVNGKLTVSENVADLGGVACALEAAKQDDDFSARDFFINFATIWRMKARDEYMQMLASIDVHAPAKLRTNVTLPNFDDFHEEFDIKAGDPMWRAPENRVIIW